MLIEKLALIDEELDFCVILRARERTEAFFRVSLLSLNAFVLFLTLGHQTNPKNSLAAQI